MKRIIVFGLLMSIFPVLYGQRDSIKLVKYTPDFRFKEGIFLYFDQVKENNPVPKARILTPVSLNDKEFFRKILVKDVLYFYDDFGTRQEVKTDNIWGYSRNGILYIQVSGDFHRIAIFGGISHFVANITTHENRYYDPYYYRYNYYDYYYYPSRSSTYSKTEMKQFILEFDSGKIMEYNVNSVELSLMKDPELHDQYMSLGKRKKKQMKFMYIRNFNERNPVYLPSG
ncbi:MAG: hypothetical protein JSV24_02140 [Bacteroidales bacterium]|nr:MAG: hypothetical protein JSV24_02140 [Bacteroidales bacterium]